MADKLKSDQRERARVLWAEKGKQAFEADPATHNGTDRISSAATDYRASTCLLPQKKKEW
jgi:acyl-CoA reductase-like NAD-dependent aldehyde dehydrogenase